MPKCCQPLLHPAQAFMQVHCQGWGSGICASAASHQHACPSTSGLTASCGSTAKAGALGCALPAASYRVAILSRLSLRSLFVPAAGDALFQTHENLEHLAMMEQVRTWMSSLLFCSRALPALCTHVPAICEPCFQQQCVHAVLLFWKGLLPPLLCGCPSQARSADASWQSVLSE